jgi:hypothetical protein
MTDSVEEIDKECLIYTTTREPFMPVRLYFTTRNKGMLIKALEKLKCANVNYRGKEFDICYMKEAKNIGLEVGHKDVPEEIYPITLATGYIRQDSTIHLDLRSLRRAVAIIEFLAKHIPASLLKLTAMAHGTKLTVQNKSKLDEVMALDYDEFFHESRIPSSMPELIIDESNDEKEFDALNELIEDRLKNYPDVQKFEIDYSRENHNEIIKDLKAQIVLKEMTAMVHNKSGKNDTPFADNFKDMLETMMVGVNEREVVEFNQEIEDVIDQEILDGAKEGEYANAWYNYLKSHLVFPFMARCIEEYDDEDPNEPKIGEIVEILDMDDVKNCETEMFVKVRRADGTIIYRPLAQFEGIDVDDKTRNAISYWDYWLWQLYCL